jgi:hypothetical protein
MREIPLISKNEYNKMLNSAKEQVQFPALQNELLPEASMVKLESIAMKEETGSSPNLSPGDYSANRSPRRRASSLESFLFTTVMTTGAIDSEMDISPQHVKNFKVSGKSSRAGFPAWWKSSKVDNSRSNEDSTLPRSTSQSKLNAKVCFTL